MLDTATKTLQAIAADNHAAGSVTGNAIDTVGFHEALAIINAGAVGTSGTVNIKVQECDTSDGSYTDVTGAAFTEIDANNDNAVHRGYIDIGVSRKRYIRLLATVATAACDFGAVVVLGKPNREPAQDNVFSV